MPGFFRRFALATLAILLACTPAFAWNEGTHREITQLAVQTLPPSPLKNLFIKNLSRLEYFSVQPDLIRAKYNDEAEKIRHYIDLEYYGADPFDALVADRNSPWCEAPQDAAMEIYKRAKQLLNRAAPSGTRSSMDSGGRGLLGRRALPDVLFDIERKIASD